MKKSSGAIYLFVAVLLIVVGIITTSLISSVKDKESTTDIRAKAADVNTLKLSGTVSELHENEGALLVSNVKFGPPNGESMSYGTWTVITPARFRFSSVSPGSKIIFAIKSPSFNVSNKRVEAVSITVFER